ncbi:MAG: septum formation inhibitor Maf [Wenzhouxiangella sp.]|nr:MAG: septum formation inhibitor Maf [Wenzhouxiangella sp.]
MTVAETSLILASASPRRRELLAQCGLAFTVVPAQIDETRLVEESASAYVRRVAADKAAAVWQEHPGAFVLGSDTAVVLDAQVLGKPADAEQARGMLAALSGREHEVLSAVVLACPDGRRLERLSATRVEFVCLPQAWIEDYAASGEGSDKAGAYGIQNQAGLWIRRIDGSYTGVVGLPLFETAELLREAGLL